MPPETGGKDLFFSEAGIVRPAVYAKSPAKAAQGVDIPLRFPYNSDKSKQGKGFTMKPTKHITPDMLFDPPMAYRSHPFWSWNTKLSTGETRFQVKEMAENGIGGFFMHARGGLKTDYMGAEWMDNVREAVRDGYERGMSPWGYDENGWPSGFGSGAVNGLGVKYQQKYVHMDVTDAPVDDDFTIGNVPSADGKNLHFYFSVNRFYVDTMDAEVTDAFIASTHEKYKEALGEDFHKMAGFFTDEPQMSRKPGGIPWSLILPREYKAAYGEELLPVLVDLFVDSERAVRTRYRYFRLITKLFSENFMGKIYDWCNKNGTRLTGHMVLEECFSEQLDSNGACMPNYMYMHIPGCDKLCRSVSRDLLAPQVTSICAQTGKKQVLTESFALCGWDVSFEELKWILEWQMVKGVNLLCQHLEGYSLGGLRKRDYPAGHFFQNPWWKDYHAFLDLAARIGMLLAEGEITCDILVLHTISSAWVNRCDDHDWRRQVNETYNKPLIDVLTALDTHQIPHHLGDETVMERIGSVRDGKLVIGEMAYATVIVPAACVIGENTLRLLKEFKAQGGELLFIGEVPAYVAGEKSDAVKALCDRHFESTDDLLDALPAAVKDISLKHADGSAVDVQAARRSFDDFTMYYLVNTYSGKENAELTVKGKSLARFDYMTGKVEPYPFAREGACVKAPVDLEAKGSVIFFVYDDERFVPFNKVEKARKPLAEEVSGKWKIVASEPNAITLDHADVYFDGTPVGENMPVIDVEEKANALCRKVNVKLVFKVKSAIDVPGKLHLVLEEAPFYDVNINGKTVEKVYDGYFRDKAFIKLDISGAIVKGDNVITLTTDFVQPDHIYETIKDCYEFEAMRNKLWYDREIEDVYLLGDFSVVSDAPFEQAPNRSHVTDGPFTLVKRVTEVEADKSLTLQGYPFYTGKMALEKVFTLAESETEGRTLAFDRMGAVVTKAKVNGDDLGTMIYAPYRFDLDGKVKAGENVLRVELTNNFRNLLGPLHLGGESYTVTPSSFQHDSRIFGGGLNRNYTDRFAFLEYGLFFKA